MRKMNIAISMLAISTMSLTAMAQSGQPKGKDRPQPPAGDRPAPRGGGEGGGRGGQMAQLSPEKSKAAQELAATGVAKRNGLNDEQTKALVAAYLEARTSHGAATQKLRDEQREKMRDAGDDRQAAAEAMQKAVADLNKSESAKFEKALGDKIPADKKIAVVGSLGTFTPQWDRWVDALSEFKLEAAKQQSGLNAIEDFVVAQGKYRGGGDREAMRTANQENRQKLTDTMKKILSEEQFTKFEASMGGGGRGRGGPGGGGGGGGGGGEPK